MQVAKWGNSLAVRLPAAVVEALEIKEGDDIEIEVEALLDVVDHILPQEGQHWVSPSYICHILRGEPAIREPEKCSAIGWFAPQEIPANLTAVTRQNLAHYLHKIA